MTREEATARLRSCGMSVADAESVVEHLAAADAAGRTGHGLARIPWLEELLATSRHPAGRPERVERADGFERWRQCLAAALGRARGHGTLAPDVDAEVVARFLVAGIEGAILLTKVQKDIGVMEHCVGELRRHLALYRRSEGAVPAGVAR